MPAELNTSMGHLVRRPAAMAGPRLPFSEDEPRGVAVVAERPQKASGTPEPFRLRTGG